VDVGTLHGSREAIHVLEERPAHAGASRVEPEPWRAEAARPALT